MSKKEKIKELIEVFEKAKSDDSSLYSTLYKGLKDIDAIDHNYMDNFKRLKGDDYAEKMSHLEEFTYENCCTVLTYLLRSERFVEGIFFEAVEAGDVLNLLQHAYEVL